MFFCKLIFFVTASTPPWWGTFLRALQELFTHAVLDYAAALFMAGMLCGIAQLPPFGIPCSGAALVQQPNGVAYPDSRNHLRGPVCWQTHCCACLLLSRRGNTKQQQISVFGKALADFFGVRDPASQTSR